VRVSVQYREAGWVTFAVADTGIGIPKEHQGALFRDFVQLDAPIQKRLRGTGLGLALSKRLAELLGGTVAVESEVGRGSTFSTMIPIHFTPPESPSEAEGQTATKSRGSHNAG
jgi:signal transduction histidine kinase